MDRLQIRQLAIVCVHTNAEKEPGIPTVHNLGAALEFDKIGLVFLVSGSDEAVDLNRGKHIGMSRLGSTTQEGTDFALQFHFFIILGN